MKSIFEQYAEFLEDTYGVPYDREEKMVQCPECQDWILEVDWPQSTFVLSYLGNDTTEWYCPICDEMHQA